MSAAPNPHGQTPLTTSRIHSGGRAYEIDAGSPGEARAIFAAKSAASLTR
jgi:hypothetical protein